jgi:cell division protein FtsZ
MAIMTGVQSAQILGPQQAGYGILESRAEDDAIQQRRFGKMTPAGRMRDSSGPLRKKHDESIIDFIN